MGDIGQNFTFLFSHSFVWPVLGFLWVFAVEPVIDAATRTLLGKRYGTQIERVSSSIRGTRTYHWEYFPPNNFIRRWDYFFNFAMLFINIGVLVVSFGLFLDSFKYYVQ